MTLKLAIHGGIFTRFLMNKLKFKPWIALLAPSHKPAFNLKIKGARRKTDVWTVAVSKSDAATVAYSDSCRLWLAEHYSQEWRFMHPCCLEIHFTVYGLLKLCNQYFTTKSLYFPVFFLCNITVSSHYFLLPPLGTTL